MTNDLALAALVRWPVVPSEGKADAANQPARHCEPRRGVAIQRPYPKAFFLDRVATLAMTAPVIANVVKHPSRCAANLHRWPSRPR